MTERLDISIAFGYALIIGFLLWRSKLVKQSGFPVYVIPVLFAIKCVLAILYSKMHLLLYNGGDTFQYFNEGNIIFQTIKENPLKYIYLTFGPNSSTNEFPELIKQEILEMGFWGDTSAYMVVRFNAIVRLVSFGSFYTHGIFMSALSTIGLVWLYKAVCNDPQNKLTWLFFALPSVLFWTSGVHKEGLLIFTLGGMFLSIAKLNKAFSIKYLIAVVGFAFGTFLIRDFIFYLLIPGWIAYWLSHKVTLRPIFVYVAVYLTLMIAGLWLPVSNSGNYISMITAKHQEFQLINYGNTTIEAPKFHDSLLDVIVSTPKALINSLFGPFLIPSTTQRHWLLIIDSLYILLLWFILIAVNYKQSGIKPFDSSTLWLLGFGISLLIIIGLIVPNVGAIIRYRSIAIAIITIALVGRLADTKVIPLNKTI